MGSKWIDTLPEIEAIIKECDVCYLAMTDDDLVPYIVPMNFGYADGWLYFHGDEQGRKMDLLRKEPIVSIAMSTGHELFHRHETVACSYGMEYKSVVLEGKAEIIEDFDQKLAALKVIMHQYTQNEFNFSTPAVKNVAVFRVPLTASRGKIYGRHIR